MTPLVERKAFRRIALIIGLAAVVLIASARHSFDNSITRLRNEHGLLFPDSTTAIECRGDAWLRYVDDCGASSIFELPTSDIAPFLPQLQVTSKITGDSHRIFPGNPQYQVNRWWMSGMPIATLHCSSPTGTFLVVQTWPIDESRVGICLYTDWN